MNRADYEKLLELYDFMYEQGDYLNASFLRDIIDAIYDGTVDDFVAEMKEAY